MSFSRTLPTVSEHLLQGMYFNDRLHNLIPQIIAFVFIDFFFDFTETEFL